MTRSLLHAIATVVALVPAFVMFAGADMRVRMAIYALGWIACGAAYLLLLYCRQYLLDTVDERVRRVLDDQRTAEELRRYQRRLRFKIRWRSARRNKDE